MFSRENIADLSIDADDKELSKEKYIFAQTALLRR